MFFEINLFKYLILINIRISLEILANTQFYLVSLIASNFNKYKCIQMLNFLLHDMEFTGN
jgi:hypothetical protein